MSVKRIKKYLPVVGVLIFVYILLKLDLSKILEEISNANKTYILIAISFVIIGLITQTFKWFIIAKIQKIDVNFINAFKINLITIYYGFITPARMGNVLRAEYLRNYNNSNLGKGVSNYIIDKVLDLSSVVFLIIIFSFIFRKIIPGGFFYYSLFIWIFLVISLVIFRDEKRSRSLLRGIYRKLVPEKIKEKAKQGFYSFYRDMPKKRFFILFFILNLLNWFILYLSVFYIGVSLGINAPIFYYLAILPISTLIGQLPITISGLGTREASLIFLFGLFGVGAEKVFSMSIIGLIISGVIPAIIGSFLIFKNKKRR